MRPVKRPPRARGLALLLSLLAPAIASAQDPPPKIGLFVVDLHATIPRFPRESTQLAASRGLDHATCQGPAADFTAARICTRYGGRRSRSAWGSTSRSRALISRRDSSAQPTSAAP